MISSNIDLLENLYKYIKILIEKIIYEKNKDVTKNALITHDEIKNNNVTKNDLMTNDEIKNNNVVIFMDNISNISYKIIDESTQNEILVNLDMYNKIHYHLFHLCSTYDNIIFNIKYGDMVSNIQHLLTSNIMNYERPLNSKSNGVVGNVLDQIRDHEFNSLKYKHINNMTIEGIPKTENELAIELELLQDSNEKSNLFGSYRQFKQNGEGVEGAAPKESEPEPKVGEYWQNAQNLMRSGISAPKGKPASKTEEGAHDPLSNTQEGAGDPITNGGNSEPTPNASGIAEKDEEGKPEGEIAEEFDQTPVTQVNPAPHPPPRPPPRPRIRAVTQNTPRPPRRAPLLPRGTPVTPGLRPRRNNGTQKTYRPPLHPQGTVVTQNTPRPPPRAPLPPQRVKPAPPGNLVEGSKQLQPTPLQTNGTSRKKQAEEKHKRRMNKTRQLRPP